MFEELFGVRPTIYTDHQALITKAGVDAVDMCLPHGLHHSIAVDCMEGGLDVLSGLVHARLAIGLQLGREVGRRAADQLVTAAAAEQLERAGVAVDEAIVLQHDDAVVGGREVGAIARLGFAEPLELVLPVVAVCHWVSVQAAAS